MPKCSLVHCGAKKSKYQPELTLHKLPTNNKLSKKWLKIIGAEHLNPHHNVVKVCSLHFHESCFNSIGRLNVDALPTLFLPREISKSNIPILYEKTKDSPKSRMPVLCITPKPDSSNSVVIESVLHDDKMQSDDDDEVKEEYLEDVENKEDFSENEEVEEEYLEDEEDFNVEFLEEDDDSEKISQEVTTRRVFTLEKMHVPSEKSNIQKPTMSTLLEKRLILSEKYDLKEPIMSTMLDKILSKKPDSEKPSVSTPEKRIVLSEKPDVLGTTLSIAAQQQSYKIREQADLIEALKKRIVEQKKNAKRLSVQVRRRDIKVATLESTIKTLKGNEDSQSLILNAGPKLFDSFLKKQCKPNNVLSLKKDNSDNIRKLAMTLNFLSPKAYDFIRNTYNKSLPSPNVLSDLCQSVNADEGSKVETLKNIWSEVKQADSPTVGQGDPVTVLVVENDDTENQIEI